MPMKEKRGRQSPNPHCGNPGVGVLHSGKETHGFFAVFVFCFKTEVALGSFIYLKNVDSPESKQCNHCLGSLVLL